MPDLEAEALLYALGDTVAVVQAEITVDDTE